MWEALVFRVRVRNAAEEVFVLLDPPRSCETHLIAVAVRARPNGYEPQ